MKIELRKLEDLKPYPQNAKGHPKEQVKKIVESILAFGFNQPIVVDKEDVIIVGHGRFLAAQELQLTEVPTLKVDLPDEKVKAYRLADNKLNESEWKLDLVLEELKLLPDDIALLTGFDKTEVLKMFEPSDKQSKLDEEKKWLYVCPSCKQEHEFVKKDLRPAP